MNENSTTSINDLEMVDTRLTDDAKRIANQPGLIEPASSKLEERSCCIQKNMLQSLWNHQLFCLNYWIFLKTRTLIHTDPVNLQVSQTALHYRIPGYTFQIDLPV
ncbi:hypothetical protein B9Z55_017408 [Caenorhabditis nigoni]|uniref:Uncharacterized protein n=1 Tax=Caenorhabditis nigoni TaxID=1611254 RepID=A0A2G5T9D1_9PELO|nr:hypothetical protein B9Z55_017408 [Caenorhabditis nigoni]